MVGSGAGARVGGCSSQKCVTKRSLGIPALRPPPRGPEEPPLHPQLEALGVPGRPPYTPSPACTVSRTREAMRRKRGWEGLRCEQRGGGRPGAGLPRSLTLWWKALGDGSSSQRFRDRPGWDPPGAKPRPEGLLGVSLRGRLVPRAPWLPPTLTPPSPCQALLPVSGQSHSTSRS